MTTINFYFTLVRHYLLGVERGMYMDDHIEINEECFGDRYVTKINMLYAMFSTDPFLNLIPIIAIFYQFYFMLGDRCTIDRLIHDVFTYCWNEGCYFEQMWSHTEANFLYMSRAMIDAAIVWYEGVPSSMDENPDQWKALSRQTGETISEILKEITNFKAEAVMREENFSKETPRIKPNDADEPDIDYSKLRDRD